MNYIPPKIDLYDYNTWIGKTPVDVLFVVGVAGSWAKAYSDTRPVPLWLSRLRNFFNIRPIWIMRTASIEATLAGLKLPSGKFGPYSRVVAAYKDDQQRFWFQTPPAGTIWHSKGDPDDWKAAKNTVGGQSVTETFKLLHMDGTGGSSELILENYAASIAHNADTNWFGRIVHRHVHGGGKDHPTKLNEKKKLRRRTMISERYAASYNFGDFYMSSDATHKRMDVKTHSKEKGFYLPVLQQSKLVDRVFPKAWQGIDIADSDRHFSFSH